MVEHSWFKYVGKLARPAKRNFGKTKIFKWDAIL